MEDGLKKRTRKQPPTQRQKEYAAGRIASPRKTKKDVALEAGYPESMAAHATTHIENSKGVQEILQSAITKAGITDEFIAKRMKEGCDAVYKSGDTDFKERREMIDLVLETTGKKAAQQHEHSGKVGLYQILEESFGE